MNFCTASELNLLSDFFKQKREKQKQQPVRVEKKVGRNELCPCGSGKKYKHCCGQ